MRNMIAAILAALALALTAVGGVLNVTLTADANTNIDLRTALQVANGGDLKFTGSSLVPQGSALVYPQGAPVGMTPYNNLTLTVLQTFPSSAYTSATIQGSQLVVNELVAVKTNGGNFGKFLITAISPSSISMLVTTYDTSGGGGGGGPTITGLSNNAGGVSSLTAGLAPSTLFAADGTNLATPGSAAVLQDTVAGLPFTLNGGSGFFAQQTKTFPVALYYATEKRIAGGVPGDLQPGLPTTFTWTYNGQSATTNVNIVPSSPGIDVFWGNYGVFQHSFAGDVITPTNSAKPKDVLTGWGGGFAGNTLDSATKFEPMPHTLPGTYHLYIGNVEQNILGVSASPYPAVQVVVFSVVPGTPNGCFEPVTLTSGTGTPVLSSPAVISIADNGGNCNDPPTGLDGNAINTFTGQATVRTGSLMLSEVTTLGQSGGPSDLAIAQFQSISGSTFITPGLISDGCVFSRTFGTSTIPFAGIDVGAVTLVTPDSRTIPLGSSLLGQYAATVPVPISQGGTFTLNATGGTGSNSPGPFSTSFAVPGASRFTLINPDALANIQRNSPLTIPWSGGFPNSFVIVNLSSTSGGTTGATTSATCIAPAGALQITVPAYIMANMQSGNASISVQDVYRGAFLNNAFKFDKFDRQETLTFIARSFFL